MMTDQYYAHAMRIITVAFIIVALAFILSGCGAGLVEADPTRVGDCLPGLIAPVYGHSDLTDLDMAALRNMEAVGAFWKQDGAGYGYFDIPADNTSAGDVRGHVAGDPGGFYDAGVSAFESATTPGIVYVLVYADLAPDEPGAEHEGTHPCAALMVDAGAWLAWKDGMGR